MSFILFFISYKLLKHLKITRINRIFLSTVISYLIYISKNMQKNPSKKISIYITIFGMYFIILSINGFNKYIKAIEAIPHNNDISKHIYFPILYLQSE